MAIPTPIRDTRPRSRDGLLAALGVGFLALVLAATTYFHVAERLSWVDALYFVVATVATVGYGDINLLNAPASHKLVDIGLNARAMDPGVRVILRLFDPVMADRIKAQLDIHLALSMSAIAARQLVDSD